MATVTQPDLDPSCGLGRAYSSPCHCDLPDMIRCWSRNVQELRANLATARGEPDEEVLWIDLRLAEAHLARLLAIAQSQKKAA